MTGAKSMRYLEVGATVYYKREKAKVIEKYKEGYYQQNAQNIR